MIETGTTFLFSVSICIQFVFFIFIFRRLAVYVSPLKNEPVITPVSVIICAHNEKENLQELLPIIFLQDYKEFEIIVVDDRSQDGTWEYLIKLAESNPQLKLIQIKEVPSHLSPKKNALTQGILQASHGLVLLTDADCRPCSYDWISGMNWQIRGSKEVCLGYSPYQKHKGILNLMIRFETFYTAIQYFSLALAGKPYMGVGRNLAYTKALFIRNKGFEHHKTIWSGDDDLFGNQSFKKDNITVSIGSESQVLSKPKMSFKDWFYQKSRHLSAGIHYRKDIKFILGLLLFSHCFFYLTWIAILIMNGFTLLMIIGFIFRTLLIIYIFVQISKKFHEHFTWYWLPVLDFLYLISYILFGFNSILSKNSRWT